MRAIDVPVHDQQAHARLGARHDEQVAVQRHRLPELLRAAVDETVGLRERACARKKLKRSQRSATDERAANRNTQVRQGAGRKWPLDDGQLPDIRVVACRPRFGLQSVCMGIGVQQRHGRVSSSPIRNPCPSDPQLGPGGSIGWGNSQLRSHLRTKPRAEGSKCCMNRVSERETGFLSLRTVVRG